MLRHESVGESLANGTREFTALKASDPSRELGLVLSLLLFVVLLKAGRMRVVLAGLDGRGSTIALVHEQRAFAVVQ